MKKILLVGADVAPTKCFQAITPFLTSSGLTVSAILESGKPGTVSDEVIKEKVLSADLILIGLSSSEQRAETEIRAAKLARESSKPYGFYSDMALCPFRPWLNDLARNASFIVGLLPKAQEALVKMYPKARMYHTGNPLRTTSVPAGIDRESVRARLEVLPHEKLVLASGSKFPAGNFQIWGNLIESIWVMPQKRDITLFLAPHPGDPGLRTVDESSGEPLAIYDEMAKGSPVRTIFNKMPTREAIVGADLVVDFTGDTSVLAAMLRIPLLNITTELLLGRFERETGSRTLETIANGSGHHVDLCSVGGAIERFLYLEEARREIMRRQEQAYLADIDPEKSTTDIVSAILNELVAK